MPSQSRKSPEDGPSEYDASSINSFLHNHNTTRSVGLVNGSNWVPSQSSRPRGAASSLGYANQIRSPRQSTTSSGGSSYMLSSGGTEASYVLDYHRSASPASTLLDPEDNLDPIFECEWTPYDGCQATYNLLEEDEWYNHIIQDHLELQFPKKSQCWYCDEVFKPDSEREGFRGRQNAFDRRMRHIAAHIRAGHHQGRERLQDRDFMKHLAKHRLVPDEVADAAGFPPNGPRPPSDLDMTELSAHAYGRTRRRRPSSGQAPTYHVGRRGGVAS